MFTFLFEQPLYYLLAFLCMIVYKCNRQIVDFNSLKYRLLISVGYIITFLILFSKIITRNVKDNKLALILISENDIKQYHVSKEIHIYIYIIAIHSFQIMLLFAMLFAFVPFQTLFILFFNSHVFFPFYIVLFNKIVFYYQQQLGI